MDATRFASLLRKRVELLQVFYWQLGLYHLTGYGLVFCTLSKPKWNKEDIWLFLKAILKNVERSREKCLLDCQELLKVPDGIIPNAVFWPQKIIVWVYSFVEMSVFCPDGLTILLLSVLGIWFYTGSTIVEYSRISILRPLLGKCQEATVILFSKFLPLSSKYTWTERPLPHLSVVLFLSQKQTPFKGIWAVFPVYRIANRL